MRFVDASRAPQRPDAQSFALLGEVSVREAAPVLRDERQRAREIVARVRPMRALEKIQLAGERIAFRRG